MYDSLTYIQSCVGNIWRFMLQKQFLAKGHPLNTTTTPPHEAGTCETLWPHLCTMLPKICLPCLVLVLHIYDAIHTFYSFYRDIHTTLHINTPHYTSTHQGLFVYYIDSVVHCTCSHGNLIFKLKVNKTQ